MKEFRDFIIPVKDLKEKFDIPTKCEVSHIRFINDQTDLEVKTYVKKKL